ncbi:hypothetical protein [Polaromonas sp. UC242_47]|uniref:hypothetical protein n=1 Tax=Polaromonas sp. UC242_47 TaxID=3374626 RepID=UPI0037B275FC
MGASSYYFYSQQNTLWPERHRCLHRLGCHRAGTGHAGGGNPALKLNPNMTGVAATIHLIEPYREQKQRRTI